jgi:branched-chain amino acid transport system ATP-binding protein
MLKVENISCGYGKKQVLYNVSVTVNTGEIALISGGNGSGKSTLLKCIYNIIPTWNGAVFLDDEYITGCNPSDLIRKGLIYIPQKDFCFENLTVDENLRIAGNIYKETFLNNRIQEVYETTGLQKLKKNKPFHLSGGEKKLLAFGMGLLHQPKIVLFDEPFAGVDSKTVEYLIDLFLIRLKKIKCTTLIVEHSSTIDNFFTTIIQLELGCLKNIKHI